MPAVESIAAVRHTISVARAIHGAMSRSKHLLGVDAKHAIEAIPGAFDVRVESEVEGVAVVSYVWQQAEKFTRTTEHLAERGLRRVEWL
jgi:hypothetical protein